MLPKNMTHISDSMGFTRWDDFDVEEYVLRCYNQILEEDRLTILEVIRYLQKQGIKPESWLHVADIGAGPNLFPSMLMAPFVKHHEDGGKIDLIEYSSSNRAYLKSVIKGNERPKSVEGMWEKFEHLMSHEAELWHNAYTLMRKKSHVVAGSVFELPENYYDAVSAYFVPESITTDLATCKKAVHGIIDSVKKGGFIMTAFMLDSHEWPAGVGTKFPAVPVNVDIIRSMYAGKADIDVIKMPAPPGVRDGYEGVGLAIGVKI